MSEIKVISSKYEPRAHAMDFHSRAQRFAILVWHRRAGKTVCCINDIIDKAMQCKLPMPRYGYIAPYYKQAKDVVWTYLKLYTKDIAAKVMESELAVTLINGATIRLYGADNPDALRGIYFDGVILDEYGDMPPRLFTEIVAPALADRKGWCVFIGTPKGPNHFFELWEKFGDGNRWFAKLLKASTSGVLDEEELDLLRETMDEDSYDQEMECDFRAAVRGSYYGKLLNKCEAEGRMGDFPWDKNRPVFTAWDIGYSDDTSIWFYQTDGNTIRVIDFYSESCKSVDDVLDELAEKPYAYEPFNLPHDAKNKSFQTGKSIRELMMARDCKSKIVPNMSIQDGITAVRKILPTVQFNTKNPSVKRGVDALRLYRREWDDVKKMFKEAPLHDWTSHPADGFRMLALSTPRRGQEKAPRVLHGGPKSATLGQNVLNLESLFAERERANSKRGRV